MSFWFQECALSLVIGASTANLIMTCKLFVTNKKRTVSTDTSFYFFWWVGGSWQNDTSQEREMWEDFLWPVNFAYPSFKMLCDYILSILRANREKWSPFQLAVFKRGNDKPSIATFRRQQGVEFLNINVLRILLLCVHLLPLYFQACYSACTLSWVGHHRSTMLRRR